MFKEGKKQRNVVEEGRNFKEPYFSKPLTKANSSLPVIWGRDGRRLSFPPNDNESSQLKRIVWIDVVTNGKYCI
ncbi:hypothetical protein [Paenibacillus tianmuensis]|uniref:hypothetical protein n=1 Tax=Paenibacillus tianmuensis TaxID=624147 RepID=UPI000B8558A3|nr:hypothetical protein [Paenibacillus tianmuensis]